MLNHSHSVPSLWNRYFAECEPQSAAARARSFSPALDLVEYADHYEIVADLPGVAEDQVEVVFNEGVLELKGQRSTASRRSSTRACCA
jgi:HSP20 family molecular chaperone IbpA